MGINTTKLEKELIWVKELVNVTIRGWESSEGGGEGKVFIWEVLPFQHDLWKENCNFVPIPLTLPPLAFLCHLLGSILNFLLSISVDII